MVAPRHGTTERVLLAALIPFYALCAGLLLDTIVRGRLYSLVDISSPTAAEYPTVVGLRSESAGNELQPGDRLLALNGSDLHGIGPVGLSIRVATSDPAAPVKIVIERAGQQRRTSLPVASRTAHWPRLLASLSFAIVAVLLLLRARPSATIRTIAAAYMCTALLLTCTFAGGAGVTYASIALHVVSLTLAVPLGIRSAWMFPDVAAPASWFGRALPWPFALLGVLDASRFYDFPLSRQFGALGVSILGLIDIAVLILLTARNYINADALGRRQIRWFLLGAYFAMLPPVVFALLAAVDPRFNLALIVSTASLGFIPIFLLIAVARYNLFDVDRLITAAASYTLLGGLLLVLILSAVPGLAYAVSGPMGLEPSLVQVALSVLLALILLPAQRRLRPRVEQVFFSERYALQQGIDRLLGDLTNCATPRDLLVLAGEHLDNLLRPESCVVYGRGERVYSPVLAHGRAVPSAFDASGPLVSALRQRRVPLAAGYENHYGEALNPFERAALETLGVPVVIPVPGHPLLAAFVCLGPKRSGDVYTPTDLVLLGAVADKVSSQLLRFDEAEILRQSQAMQEALRRYVPAPVAEQLASGRDLEVGERELTILFVDIRGYSSYAERRASADVFDTVSRYTHAVSEVVASYGGAVVEFTGDGVMAVFGAPHRLENRERTAIEAAQRIAAAVSAMQAGISIGVGIASGPVYVGNVRSADRLIWTAIGNTTNLAARLQALTRDLEASIVVDEPTWLHADTLRSTFVKHAAVAIRGRSDPMNVYAVPMVAAT
ncbi:MAG TPA: adenylate/guanylate cyclase domain-containing protein [Candidatus Acidoferrales bacterium]|nr:adenylate/guanylate cyclase domain-containing protein [Candidatus Acidoferrales bacterium]